MTNSEQPVLDKKDSSSAPRLRRSGVVLRFALGVFATAVAWLAGGDAISTYKGNGPDVDLLVDHGLAAVQGAFLGGASVLVGMTMRRLLGGRRLVARPWFVWLPTAAVYIGVHFSLWRLIAHLFGFSVPAWTIWAWMLLFPALASLWLARPVPKP